MFKKPEIFNWEQLDGKNLKIIIGKDKTDEQEIISVAGYDEKENKIYLLHSEQKVNNQIV